jgi:hypothetical protein
MGTEILTSFITMKRKRSTSSQEKSQTFTSFELGIELELSQCGTVLTGLKDEGEPQLINGGLNQKKRIESGLERKN